MDQHLAVDATFTMEFALVDNMLEVPLGATEGISVPFTGESGTPTCDLPPSDFTIDGNYFADYFEVYEPAEVVEDLMEEETESNSTMRMIIEIAVVSAIALVGALFFGGFI